MKHSIPALITLCVVCSSSSMVFAKSIAYQRPTRWRQTRVAREMPRPSLSTNFRFNPVTVHGEYESPDEGIVTVEDNKTLGDLLNYNTNYKSRLAEE